MEIIPQRNPFLFIDRVENLTPGGSAVAYKNVSMNEPYFVGHFPGEPIMPGVLIIEALAQTGAVAILSLDEYKGKNVLFGGVDKLRFKRKVIPGDILKLEVKIIKRKGPISIGMATATIEGKVAVSGELTFAIV
jgi:3-hydroxyacyl-[acyl-carrier-protein] dehydratase